MEVIAQETIGEQIGNRGKMPLEQPQEQIIIPVFHEDVFPVHTAIVDVVIGVVE
jgi:hypothetical protein